MSTYLEGDLITGPRASNEQVIRGERVWRHRHELDLTVLKSRRHPAQLLTLGAGSLLIVLACAFTYVDLGPTQNLVRGDVNAAHPTGEERVTASTRLQTIVDTAPPPIRVSEIQAAPLAFSVVPIRRPLDAPVKTQKAYIRDSIASAAKPTNVLRYNQCNLGCETRDSLIVNTIPPTLQPEGPELETPNRALELGSSVLHVAGSVLGQTAALPFTTLRLGRDALAGISELE